MFGEKHNSQTVTHMAASIMFWTCVTASGTRNASLMEKQKGLN